MTYYTTEEYMKLRFDRFARRYAYDASDKDSHERWYEKASAALSSAIGLDRCIPVDGAQAQLLDEVAFDGFVRRHYVMETEPTVFMTFYLLVPKHPNGAAMLNPHGHGGAKEACLGFSPDGKTLEYESFGVSLCRRGYYVAAPDARGSGERRERGQQGEGKESQNSHREMLNACICLGITPIGGMVWDLMRLFDFVGSIDGVDERRIGCAGMSGGGEQTIYFSALDRRVALAITSGYFYGFRDALLLQPANCGCNFAPHLYETVDMGDIGAMIAPRPFFIESGVNDRLAGASGIENVRSQVKIAGAAYENFGARSNIELHVHQGGHVWVGEFMDDFIDRHLL